MAPTSTKRLVYHIGGYVPFAFPDVAYSRFKREILRFESTWSVSSNVSPARLTNDEMRWSIVTKGADWRVETDYHLFRWDDVITRFGCQPLGKRLALGLLSFFDFALSGALAGYLRTNWYYAVFFLYPFLMFTAFVAVAILTGVVVAKSALSP